MRALLLGSFAALVVCVGAPSGGDAARKPKSQGMKPPVQDSILWIPMLAQIAYEDPQTFGNAREVDVAAYEDIYLEAFTA